jgi:indolepyruvate ferredoxin oxidoreductase alpha subunit
MGSAVTIHEGLRRARVGDRRIVGVIGDSTFVHSGITGLINSAYNRGKGLILILDNGTTAMTGGQNHPATGKTVRNEPTKQLRLEEICRACGADNVDVVRPQEYKAMVELIKTRAEADALSVIIVRSPCMLLK